LSIIRSYFVPHYNRTLLSLPHSPSLMEILRAVDNLAAKGLAISVTEESVQSNTKRHIRRSDWSEQQQTGRRREMAPQFFTGFYNNLPARDPCAAGRTQAYLCSLNRRAILNLRHHRLAVRRSSRRMFAIVDKPITRQFQVALDPRGSKRKIGFTTEFVRN
jgi:hypothetical protein